MFVAIPECIKNQIEHMSPECYCVQVTHDRFFLSPSYIPLANIKIFGEFQSFLSAIKSTLFLLKLDLHGNLANLINVSNTSDPSPKWLLKNYIFFLLFLIIKILERACDIYLKSLTCILMINLIVFHFISKYNKSTFSYQLNCSRLTGHKNG